MGVSFFLSQQKKDLELPFLPFQNCSPKFQWKNQFVGGYFAPTFKSACSVITEHTVYAHVKPVRTLELTFQGKCTCAVDQPLIRHSKSNVEGRSSDENLTDSNLIAPPSDIGSC